MRIDRPPSNYFLASVTMDTRDPELIVDILKHLDSGGQPDVVLLRLRATGGIFADKFLCEAWDPRAREAFRKEAERQARVAGDRVVAIVTSDSPITSAHSASRLSRFRSQFQAPTSQPRKRSLIALSACCYVVTNRASKSAAFMPKSVSARSWINLVRASSIAGNWPG